MFVGCSETSISVIVKHVQDIGIIRAVNPSRPNPRRREKNNFFFFSHFFVKLLKCTEREGLNFAFKLMGMLGQNNQCCQKQN